MVSEEHVIVTLFVAMEMVTVINERDRCIVPAKQHIISSLHDYCIFQGIKSTPGHVFSLLRSAIVWRCLTKKMFNASLSHLLQ